MAERVQLTHQAIRMAQDWESLPKNERDGVAREIAAAARLLADSGSARNE